VAQPHGIGDIGLATANVRYVCGVAEQQLKLALQHRPHWPPIHARGLLINVLKA
jgi:hypothetical protein